MILFKSALYREELLRWTLILVLLAWGLTATAYALSKRQEVLLVGFDQNGARIISDDKDKLLQSEAVLFIQTFLKSYLNYAPHSFETQMGKAADFMSEKIWAQEQPKLLKIAERLKKDPLSQSGEALAIDQVGEGAFEIEARIRVIRRAQVSEAKVLIQLELRKRTRTTANPWIFEISHLEERLQ